jgi:hydrogenase/urease accessory protein HupE
VRLPKGIDVPLFPRSIPPRRGAYPDSPHRSQQQAPHQRAVHAARWAVVPALAAALALSPGPAFAHGIGGDASDRSIVDFVPLGIEHMLLGWDHLLFIAGVLLVAKTGRRAAKLISLFVLGHSATLIIATVAEWQVDAAVVDFVIALSVVLVGIVALTPKEPRWTLFGGAVLAFGLVHGLGLSTRLQDLGLPHDGLIWRVVAFNVGVEIGQLTAILAMLALVSVAAMVIGEGRVLSLRTVAPVVLVLGGAAAAVVAVIALEEPNDDRIVVSASPSGSCRVEERTQRLPAGGSHAMKAFYEPEEPAPLDAFGHSVGDGYIAMLYAPDLAQDDLEALRDFVFSEDGQGILAGAFPEETGVALSAITADGQQLNCDAVDLDALSEFRVDWFESLG